MDRTPFWWACRHKNGPVKLLLDADGVDVDSKDRYNSTPLSIASRMGHKAIVAFLLTKSRSVNVKDTFGRTPLWWARRNGYAEIADLLLEKYKENNITIREDELPAAKVLVPADEIGRYCDVCVLGISDTDIYYACKVCCNGDFDVCEGCLALKAHCLDKSHTLIKKMNHEIA
jgi:ankyrin repeat protein